MNQVSQNFGNAATSYDQVGSVQLASAEHLCGLIPGDTVKSMNSLLDVGTGTGYVAEILSKANPTCQITLNDISPEMLAAAEQKLSHCPRLTTELGDAETHIFASKPYDLIVSNLTVQWFRNRQAGLGHLLSQGKVLAFSTLAENTFIEWQQAYDRLGLTSSLHPQPSIDELTQLVRGLSSRPPILDTKVVPITFDQPGDFVRYLGQLGAQTPRPGRSASTLSQVIPTIEAPFTVSYEIFYAIVFAEDS